MKLTYFENPRLENVKPSKLLGQILLKGFALNLNPKKKSDRNSFLTKKFKGTGMSRIRPKLILILVS